MYIRSPQMFGLIHFMELRLVATVWFAPGLIPRMYTCRGISKVQRVLPSKCLKTRFLLALLLLMAKVRRQWANMQLPEFQTNIFTYTFKSRNGRKKKQR